ncbi:helix-turn-helix transcriptional regulator [Actinomadura sp. NEAU-AAG7]|uniref:helix-turn-helix transcriptional regulator n=1 Tax=Actinomadura sp. NEAU-AAG7 TaxID=2839640 RepID=UPI001BE4C716|nr:helix-turn-helix transcriptional regulator [Actinomadura sp. NEAU-AAG7]MBT2207119.1 helix-turn-helix domain-containing protein [Actinomadura sp. NEAU-AAG7]
MAASTELGRFLRVRRDRLTPEDVGLDPYGSRRRVPGLRREELAQLAGVSVAYYTRLEQGQSANASDEVLDAIGRALRLDEEERAHLRGLARPPRKGARRSRPERVRPATLAVLRSMDLNPALILGRAADILAWNRPAHALLAPHLPLDAPDRPSDRPNMARLVFLEPHTRDLYADWPAKARDTVAYLRKAAGQWPDDPALTELVGELAVKNEEFAALWARHPVRDCHSVTVTFWHPLVGEMKLAEEVFRLQEQPDQRLAVFAAEPDSASESALRLLCAL